MNKRYSSNFLARLFVATVFMGGALWYLWSLRDAVDRDRNLLLIGPVVLALIPCYLAVLVHEFRRLPERSTTEAPEPADVAVGEPWVRRIRQNRTLHFIALAIVLVPALSLFGAIPVTAGFVLLGLLVLGVRKISLLVLVPAGTTAGLWAAFVLGLGIRIPLY